VAWFARVVWLDVEMWRVAEAQLVAPGPIAHFAPSTVYVCVIGIWPVVHSLDGMELAKRCPFSFFFPARGLAYSSEAMLPIPAFDFTLRDRRFGVASVLV
jgi:hypothetical protein